MTKKSNNKLFSYTTDAFMMEGIAVSVKQFLYKSAMNVNVLQD